MYLFAILKIFRFNIHLHLFAVLLLAVCGSAHSRGADFRVMEECTLIDNPANDADSFHVRWKNRSYIFRLYFVDAPETDDRFPERLQEQGEYFGGLSNKQVMVLGQKATDFTLKALEGKKFTVYTHRHEAMGASEKDRFYGMVEVEGRFLSEMLVEEGLARIHGVSVDPPRVTQRRYEMRLQGLEKEARKLGRGGWGMKAEGGADFPISIVTKRDVLLFSATHPFQVLGSYRAGHPLTVTGNAHGNLVKVTIPRGDQTMEALCVRTDLDLPIIPLRR